MNEYGILPHGQTRASDADRDKYIKILDEAAGDGRLSPGHHAARVEAALAAQAVSDLPELTADLGRVQKDVEIQYVTRERVVTRIRNSPAMKRWVLASLALANLVCWTPLIFGQDSWSRYWDHNNWALLTLLGVVFLGLSFVLCSVAEF
jgi:Domain of unknown function (DUF1707)